MISSVASSSTNTVTTTNVKKHLKEHTRSYGTKVVDWLANEGNFEEDNVEKYDKKYDNKKHENIKESIENMNTKENIDIDIPIIRNKQSIIRNSSSSSSSFSSSKEIKFPKEELFKEGSDSIQSFEETLQTISTSSNSTSSTPYSAELVQTPTNISFSYSNINENEPLSPIKPLRAMTNSNTSKRSSNVYEILQEIKPDHPLRINTQFDFNTNNNHNNIRRSSLLHNSISHNPLSHHHRNSVLYVDKSSPTSARNSRRDSRNSINYTPPRRYSNTRRSSLTRSVYENKNEVNNYFNNYNINIIQEKNIDDNSNYNNNDVNNNNKFDGKMYAKYFFWFGFLFIPIWWLGSFYKPNGTEDYKWRKRCRIASVWVFVALVITLIIFLIVEQRQKTGM
ncbi:hypothetical protein RclHR1_13850005 [Rhizophagus clarus]|uniref:Uncharacterized protein n=1 Tax=Rhizophagus clarus TaxID=94130 RepID=A0A2Z6QB38_9GLOM|nr:hypothetical protein RclHR1_13850005 [Rhizophagus clarus]GES88465.1 hypothetical protein GLOIN_2v1618084 [Rhizophagus clarus]